MRVYITEEQLEEAGLMQCWCGAIGRPHELFEKITDHRCGGSGVLHCYCGGDQCVCHNHGEIECDGCPDCLDNDGYDYSDDWIEDDPWDSPEHRKRLAEIAEQERTMWEEYEAERRGVRKDLFT